jgi:hypothetical protein
VGIAQPDIALAYPELEDMAFLIGEVGYSDSRAFTKERIQNWLAESQGKICHWFYLSK